MREGNLVDYDAVRIKSDVRINGVFLQAGDQVDNVDPETGASELDVLEDERDYAAADVEQKINVPDSNRRILQEIKRYADEHEREYGRFPKTLIFAAQDLPHRSHADQLVDAGPRSSSGAARTSLPRSPARSTGRCSASASSATGRTPASW